MIATLQKSGGGPETKSTAAEKELKLRTTMRELNKVLVAYSGGVDSAYLSLIATQELGENASCILGISPSVSAVQRAEAADTAAAFGFNFSTLNTEELADPNYSSNPQNRCYFCKSELYKKLARAALGLEINYILDGTNADDLGDHRPGMTAAREKGVRSPLADVGMTKSEIRERSRELGLPGWDKPASPCLSSRVAYGIPVTIERLSKIERGEQFLRDLGFREFRVRVHGELVRIEVAPGELERALNKDVADSLAASFKNFGFRYVTLDLHGYRPGAMNEVIKTK